ncbi:hypothetical protein WICPIJ_003120 [Wickerhamomyces pijperi]|uniref:Uncharacterized protein n=1 Tax=Wickerhamomyces pijperi TaxID=599730 RepID=A0A9P8TP03_WICPI|nr:hypothetical protein WICPIJ_003120 [Wickerhamomyces pijperi]
MSKPSQISTNIYNDIPSSDTESFPDSEYFTEFSDHTDTEEQSSSSRNSDLLKKQKADQDREKYKNTFDRLMLLKEITPNLFIKDYYSCQYRSSDADAVARWLADFCHILENFGFQSSSFFNESTETGPSEEESIIVNSVLIQKTKILEMPACIYRDGDCRPLIMINRDPRKNIAVILEKCYIDLEKVRSLYSYK